MLSGLSQVLRFLSSIYELPSLFSLRDTAILVYEIRIFLLQNMKFSTLQLGGVRVLSCVANLAPNLTSQILVVFEI